MDINKKEQEFLKHQLECFFRRKYIYEGLKKVDAPEMVQKSARKRYDETVAFFRNISMDVEAYVQTPKGMVAYLEYSVEEDTYNKMSDRCGQCINYSYLESRRGPHSAPMGCDIHEDENLSIILCKNFIDTEESFMRRIQKYVIERCSECQHLKQIEIKSIEDIDEDRCLMGCNRLKTVCEHFLEIISPLEK
jgi:hypothetical protein